MANERAIKAMSEFLEAVGVDIKARGMEKTPARVAQMYEFLFNGMGKETEPLWGETFDAGSDGIVAVRHVPFYSMC